MNESDMPKTFYVSACRSRLTSMKLLPILAALFLLTGCASAAPASKPTPTADPAFFALGTMSTPASLSYFPPGADAHTLGDICMPTDGYTDIAEGGQVVIADAAGETVALGKLAPGVLTAGKDPESMIGATCVFRFAVEVDAASKFYSVKIGNENRGALQYTQEDLEGGIALTLG